MRARFNELSAAEVLTAVQRLALRAAVMGFSISLAIMILYMATPQVAATAVRIRPALDAICVLLWPSAIIMLGAQTYHGGTLLFLLSACLNAAYFAVAAMIVMMLVHRFNFKGPALKVTAPAAQLSGRPLSEGLRRAGPTV